MQQQGLDYKGQGRSAGDGKGRPLRWGYRGLKRVVLGPKMRMRGHLNLSMVPVSCTLESRGGETASKTQPPLGINVQKVSWFQKAGTQLKAWKASFAGR